MSKDSVRNLGDSGLKPDDISYALEESTILAVTDLKGTITYVNERFCEISQYSSEELVGNNHNIVNSGHHSKEFFQKMWKTISSGETWKGEIKNKAKDGSYYWVETTIVPLLDEEGRPQKYLALRIDITYKKQSQELIDGERARAIYSSRMASLGEMAAGIAHELGNPLVAIRGRMEMLIEQIDKGIFEPENIKERAEKILVLIDRMSKIIRGVSSYAREGSRDPFTEASINNLLDNIIEFSTEKLRRLGITVYKEGFQNNLVIDCREAEIGQVFVNLFSNSCDAIRDLDEKWIRVEIESIDGHIQIRFIDSGEGVPKAVQEKIFESFYTTKPVGRGTGLGLSVSKKIVEAHGGSLYIDNNIENTCFVVSLAKHPKND